MAELFDPQMCRLADFDCFSQVVFEDIEDYKRMKQDPWYKTHLAHDHEVFADTKRSMSVQRLFLSVCFLLRHFFFFFFG